MKKARKRMKNIKENKIADILFGCAVGDVLGVPYEFMGRETFYCTDMSEYGTHNQPKGTWSDDTSMTLCLADCIAKGFSVEKLAENFLRWYEKSEFTANGELFDIGNATSTALARIKSGVKCTLAGGADEWSNGNGSLMRIAPLALYTIDMPIEKRFEICRQVSSITHRHQTSILACFLYLEFLRNLMLGNSLESSLEKIVETKKIAIKLGVDNSVVQKFYLFDEEIRKLSESEISSSGYVVDTFIASIWCVLNTNSYKEAVLKAVNLGDDTDTTGAVTGVIAGILYGYNNIPEKWISSLKNKELIDSIVEEFDFMN